jgi:hypothetical protein
LRRFSANVPNSLVLSAVMMEAMLSSETSVLTTTTRRHISKDGILHVLVKFDIYKYIYASFGEPAASSIYPEEEEGSVVIRNVGSY